MTTISWNGGPILKSGAIGTEQSCCCGCAPCCISGSRVAGPLYDTQAECEAEGGVWVPTADCSPLPACQANCVCNNDSVYAPQICINGVCTDVDISATWCGMTVNVANPVQTVTLTPNYDCGNGNVVGAKVLNLSWYCEYVCNCVVVTVVVGVMQGTGVTPREYTAKRSVCGSSLDTSSMTVSLVSASGVCGDAWYTDAGCDYDPTITINFAP